MSGYAIPKVTWGPRGLRVILRPSHEHAYRLLGLTHKPDYSYPSLGPRNDPVLLYACDCGDYRWQAVYLGDERRVITTDHLRLKG